jgi:mediator of RNA polymerase II transcription subunit 31
MSSPPPPPATNPELSLPKNRFELELEFIQSLASPRYLHHLANQNYLRDESFLQFLQYLKYWKQPEYAKFITYPHCFFFLDLLCDNETFRNELVNVEFQNFVHQQQFFNWQFRSRLLYGTGTAAVAEGEATLADGDQPSVMKS